MKVAIECGSNTIAKAVHEYCDKQGLLAELQGVFVTVWPDRLQHFRELKAAMVEVQGVDQLGFHLDDGLAMGWIEARSVMQEKWGVPNVNQKVGDPEVDPVPVVVLHPVFGDNEAKGEDETPKTPKGKAPKAPKAPKAKS